MILLDNYKRGILLLSFCSVTGFLFSQNTLVFQEVRDSQFYETMWKYEKTIDQASGLAVHNPDKAYRHFIYFMLSGKMQEYQNGQLSDGIWTTDGTKLMTSIGNISVFDIVKLSAIQLIVEYAPKTGVGRRQLVFSSSEDSELFVKPESTINLVKVEAKTKGDTKDSWISQFFAWITGEYQQEEISSQLKIELIGGGFMGGLDPVIKNYIVLYPNGRLIREYASQFGGTTKSSQQLKQSEINALSEFIDQKKFFEISQPISCLQEAQRRMLKSPRPIPLRLAITDGIKHKVIEIPIYGRDESKSLYCNPPIVVEQIVEGLNRMVLSSLAKK